MRTENSLFFLCQCERNSNKKCVSHDDAWRHNVQGVYPQNVALKLDSLTKRQLFQFSSSLVSPFSLFSKSFIKYKIPWKSINSWKYPKFRQIDASLARIFGARAMFLTNVFWHTRVSSVVSVFSSTSSWLVKKFIHYCSPLKTSIQLTIKSLTLSFLNQDVVLERNRVKAPNERTQPCL